MMKNDNLAFTEMAAGLAHEVKNPLSMVHAHLDILELDEQGDGIKDHYQKMRLELNKINDLLYEFLSLSTEQIQTTQGKREIVHMGSLLQEIVIPFQQAYLEMIWVVDDKTQSPLVVGDRRDITIVLENIIKNAVEATAQLGRVEIFLAEEGEMISVTCRDNGPGMPKDMLGFFNEGIPGHSTKKDGSGFGLYQVSQIISSMGGQMQIKNLPSPLHGCQVRIDLKRS